MVKWNFKGFLIQQNILSNFFWLHFFGLMRKTLFWVLFKLLKVCNKEEIYLNIRFFTVWFLITVDKWSKSVRSFPTAFSFQNFLRLKLRFLKLKTHHCPVFVKCLSAHSFFINLISIPCFVIHKLYSFQILYNFDVQWHGRRPIPSDHSFLRTTLSNNQRNWLKTLD